MPLLFKRLSENASLPRRATPESAGLDLCACLSEDVVIKPFERVRIPTGLVYPRSGLSSKYGVTLSNCVGVVDSDYRGELQIPMTNHSNTPFTIRHGDRIAQLVVTPILLPEPEETDTLPETLRGEGGFGSTGMTFSK